MKKKEAQTAAIDFVRRLAGYFDDQIGFRMGEVSPEFEGDTAIQKAFPIYAERIILYRHGLAPGADGDDDDTTNEEFLQEVAKALGGPIHE